MAPKRKDRETLETVLARPWCYYCNRDFEDEKNLHDHQKAIHFKCQVASCHRRLNTVGGLMVHMQQVHKEELKHVPEAAEGRDNLKIEIYASYGIPEELNNARRDYLLKHFHQMETDHYKRTGNPLPGSGRTHVSKKPKLEDRETKMARVRAAKAKMLARKAARAAGLPEPVDEPDEAPSFSAEPPPASSTPPADTAPPYGTPANFGGMPAGWNPQNAYIPGGAHFGTSMPPSSYMPPPMTMPPSTYVPPSPMSQPLMGLGSPLPVPNAMGTFSFPPPAFNPGGYAQPPQMPNNMAPRPHGLPPRPVGPPVDRVQSGYNGARHANNSPPIHQGLPPKPASSGWSTSQTAIDELVNGVFNSGGQVPAEYQAQAPVGKATEQEPTTEVAAKSKKQSMDDSTPQPAEKEAASDSLAMPIKKEPVSESAPTGDSAETSSDRVDKLVLSDNNVSWEEKRAGMYPRGHKRD